MTTDPREALERLTRWRDGPYGILPVTYGTASSLFAGDVGDLLSAVGQMREALKPFAVGGPAELLADEDYSVMRERIVDWFGPSDFKAAREAYGAAPTEDSNDR